MPNSKGFQLHDAALLLLPPFARSLRWRLAYAMPKKKKKNLKIQKHTVALKGEHCPTKTPCGGCAMALAAGRAPQETSAAFPPGRHGQPHAYSYLQGLLGPRGDRQPDGEAAGKTFTFGIGRSKADSA